MRVSNRVAGGIESVSSRESGKRSAAKIRIRDLAKPDLSDLQKVALTYGEGLDLDQTVNVASSSAPTRIVE